ncbi:hypothetical protein V2I01_15025 [Micromonospora sp. BRA006-A]|nr:hypothetical protein [Micromonospora sp. BRA006-A]
MTMPDRIYERAAEIQGELTARGRTARPARSTCSSPPPPSTTGSRCCTTTGTSTRSVPSPASRCAGWPGPARSNGP